MILSRAMKTVSNVLIKYGNYLTKHSRLPLNPHRLLFVGLIQNSSIMRSVPVPLSGYSYLQLYVLQGSQVNMLRHVIADPKDTFSVTGGVKCPITRRWITPRHWTQPKTARRRVQFCMWPSGKPPAPETGSRSNRVFNNALVLLFLEAASMNVTLSILVVWIILHDLWGLLPGMISFNLFKIKMY